MVFGDSARHKLGEQGLGLYQQMDGCLLCADQKAREQILWPRVSSRGSG
jgi:hypothetical protein